MALVKDIIQILGFSNLHTFNCWKTDRKETATCRLDSSSLTLYQILLISSWNWFSNDLEFLFVNCFMKESFIWRYEGISALLWETPFIFTDWFEDIIKSALLRFHQYVLTVESMRSFSARISLFVISDISLGNGTATIVLSVQCFPNYNNKSDFCTLTWFWMWMNSVCCYQFK